MKNPMKSAVTGILTLVLLSACYVPIEPEPSSSHMTAPVVAGEDGVNTAREAKAVVRDVARDSPDPPAFNALLLQISELSHVPIYKDSRAELLIDGPATYRVMTKAIAQAQDSIYLETYIFADDKVGQQFADQLKDKARAGVTVCVIYDAIGSVGSSRDFFTEMQDAGVHVIEFNAINPLANGNPLDANNRDHRKLLVVDDTVAFTGGINFSETYSSGSGAKPKRKKLIEGWRDTHLAIYGPAVAGFKHTFAEQWKQQGGGAGLVLESSAPPQRAGDDLIVALQADGDSSGESPIYRAYLQAIEMAVERIWITQAYFLPDQRFLDQLKQAAGRGVDVRILVPGVSDSNLVLYASKSHYGDLIQHGVRLYENSAYVLHAKTAVIDGIWSTVGSSNLDFRSFLHNDEINAIVVGVDFAASMESQFKRDVEVSTEVTLYEWKERPLTQKLQEVVGRSVEYWL